MMAWSQVLGYGIFWIGLVSSVILYAIKRKWYVLMYLVSICLYIFTVAYVIDVFDLSKNLILMLLAFSSVLMMGVGHYLSK